MFCRTRLWLASNLLTASNADWQSFWAVNSNCCTARGCCREVESGRGGNREVIMALKEALRSHEATWGPLASNKAR